MFFDERMISFTELSLHFMLNSANEADKSQWGSVKNPNEFWTLIIFRGETLEDYKLGVRYSEKLHLQFS